MARRTFQMIDLVEIYVHWYAGRSQAQIADSLGLDRKTVRKYLAPVAAEGLVPGGPPVMTEADWRDRAASWFPALVDKGLRQVTWPAIDVHRDYITAQLAADSGALVDPARAFKPKDKPRVERPMPYVRDSFWRGREFTTLEQMEVGAVRWCRDVAGARSCRSLEGAAPAAVFAAVEAGALGPLPS